MLDILDINGQINGGICFQMRAEMHTISLTYLDRSIFRLYGQL